METDQVKVYRVWFYMPFSLLFSFPSVLYMSIRNALATKHRAVLILSVTGTILFISIFVTSLTLGAKISYNEGRIQALTAATVLGLDDTATQQEIQRYESANEKMSDASDLVVGANYVLIILFLIAVYFIERPVVQEAGKNGATDQRWLIPIGIGIAMLIFTFLLQPFFFEQMGTLGMQQVNHPVQTEGQQVTDADSQDSKLIIPNETEEEEAQASAAAKAKLQAVTVSENEKTSLVGTLQPNGQRIYANPRFGITRAVIPADFEIAGDKVSMVYSGDSQPWYLLRLTNAAKDYTIDLHINPDGFGPIFPDESVKLSGPDAQTKGFVISEFEKINDEYDPDTYMYVASSEESLSNGHRYYILLSTPVEKQSEETRQLLQTFLKSIILE